MENLLHGGTGGIFQRAAQRAGGEKQRQGISDVIEKIGRQHGAAAVDGTVGTVQKPAVDETVVLPQRAEHALPHPAGKAVGQKAGIVRAQSVDQLPSGTVSCRQVFPDQLLHIIPGHGNTGEDGRRGRHDLHLLLSKNKNILPYPREICLR